MSIKQIKIFKTKSKVTTNVIKIRWRLRKDTENIDPKMSRTKNNRLQIMQSECSVCGVKKSKFVKEQETKGLLSNLGIKECKNEWNCE